MATTITYKGSDLTSFSNTSKTLRTAGKYLEGDITITAGLDVNNQNKTVIPTEASQSITADTGYSGLGTVTVNGITNTYVGSGVTRRTNLSTTITNSTYTITAEKGYYNSSISMNIPVKGATTIIPSESEQNAVSAGYYVNGAIKIAAITPTYVGSSVPTGNLTVSGPTVTASAGYYANDVSTTIAEGSVTFASTTITPGIGFSRTGQTIVASISYNYNTYKNKCSVTSGYVKLADVTVNTISVENSATLTLPTSSGKTITPTNSTQTLNIEDTYLLGNIMINPIPSQYIVPSGTLTITSVDTTTTFDATNYASVNVNLKNADVTAY